MANMILYMPVDVWKRIQYYINACAPREVTGVGTIRQIGPTELRVTEIFLPNQCSNTCYCECDDEALNGIIFDLVEDNPARAGLSSILSKIIQHVLEICGFVGIPMQTVVVSGRAPIRKTSIIGRQTGW